MKSLIPGFLLLAIFLTSGCVGVWEHGSSWESKSSEAPKSSPYMPTIHDHEKLMKAKHHSWVEIHIPKTGLVGYLMTEITGLYDIGGPKKIYYVYNKDMQRIGFVTELGSTYRYRFDDYGKTKEFVGHYEIEESVAHLLRVPVDVALKPLSVKPSRY